MRVRLRLRELLADRGMSYYALAKKSDDRISLSSAYRIKKEDGRLKFFEADLLEALCDILDTTPGELLERETPKRRRRA